MKLNQNELNKAIRLTLIGAGLVTAGISSSAFAQDEEDAKEMGAIEVVGSRIKRVDLETSQPIFTMSREDIKAQGLTSIGDVIQNLTANGSTLNSTFNNGGNGETRVDLRNIGSGRTLVLVNGRRWVGGTGLGGAVDLNTIPAAAVERIEVLKDGASVIYGSDAIAGVVNITLRNDLDGAEANMYYGQYDEGDGTKQSYDFTLGSSGERFSAIFGIGYVQEDPVFAGDREISAEPIFRTGTSFGSTTSPGGRFAVCNGTFNTTTGACSGTQTRPNGSAGQFTYDAGNTGNNWRNFLIPGDVYNFAPDNYLVTPQERVSAFGRAVFDLTDNVRFIASTVYNERKSDQLLAAMPIVLGTGPGAGTIARTIAIDANSVYNPFGKPVSRVQRRAVETGGRDFAQDVDTFGFDGYFEGQFEIGERFFSWDAGYQYQKNEQNDTTVGLFNLLALRQALGPSFRDAAGVARCGTPTAVIAGCVPMNLLGGPGSITQEMLDFSSFVAHDEFGYEKKNFFANISGDIVELPAGSMAFAAGLEHRKEFGFDQPDALINSGNTTGNARTATRGGYSLDEAYLELNVPILADVTLAQELTVNVASRYSDYSNFGDTTNSKIGFKWKPIDQLLVRGNWSEGFRAPSVGELFQGVSDSFPTLADPCSTTFGGDYNQLTADQRARCHAQGVPVGGYDQGNSQIRISVGGNPNLLPETSITKTLGMVWNPEFLTGFDVSLDWWKIELEDAITTFGGQFIVDDCILNGNAQACSLFSRAPGGAIANLLSAGLNLGEQNVEGYDLTLNYRLPDTKWGSFRFTLDNSYQSQYDFGPGPDGVVNNLVGEYLDRFNNWRLRSNLLAGWEMGDFGATWSSRYYSRQEELCPFAYNDYGFGELCNDVTFLDDAYHTITNDPESNPGYNRIGGTTYHDIAAYWNAPWNARMTLGINNAFSKDPPVSFTTFANSFDPQYEIAGRFYYFQYSQKF